MFIPEKFKSKRQIIIEMFLVKQSIPETALTLNKVQSYVRRVVREYQKELRNMERTAKGVFEGE